MEHFEAVELAGGSAGAAPVGYLPLPGGPQALLGDRLPGGRRAGRGKTTP